MALLLCRPLTALSLLHASYSAFKADQKSAEPTDRAVFLTPFIFFALLRCVEPITDTFSLFPFYGVIKLALIVYITFATEASKRTVLDKFIAPINALAVAHLSKYAVQAYDYIAKVSSRARTILSSQLVFMTRTIASFAHMYLLAHVSEEELKATEDNLAKLAISIKVENTRRLRQSLTRKVSSYSSSTLPTSSSSSAFVPSSSSPSSSSSISNPSTPTFSSSSESDPFAKAAMLSADMSAVKSVSSLSSAEAVPKVPKRPSKSSLSMRTQPKDFGAKCTQPLQNVNVEMEDVCDGPRIGDGEKTERRGDANQKQKVEEDEEEYDVHPALQELARTSLRASQANNQVTRRRPRQSHA